MIDYNAFGNEIEKLSFSFYDDLVGFKIALDSIIAVMRITFLSDEEIEIALNSVSWAKITPDHWVEIHKHVTQIREYN